jgi:GTP-binding protein YchF
MSLSIGIVGLPNVGKSTLFNALLNKQTALAANYPFATIEPNIGIVDVPDDRLYKLAELATSEFSLKFKDGRKVPEKIIPSTVKFVDIAGLVSGAHKGEGLGNKFLSHIREVKAIAHVVRAFKDADVVQTGTNNPVEDVEIIFTELNLADIQVIQNRMASLIKEVKRGNKEAILTQKTLEKILPILENNSVVNIQDFSFEELNSIKELNLISLKPRFYIVNVDEDQLVDLDSLREYFSQYKYKIFLNAQLESELSELDKEERLNFLREYSIEQSGLDSVIKLGFKILGLSQYYTYGPKEVRSWTFKSGSKAPQAAGVIHSDFERGFIAADIINFEEFYKVGTLKEAKEKGLVKLEGKEYIVNDGDIVEFKFNV